MRPLEDTQHSQKSSQVTILPKRFHSSCNKMTSWTMQVRAYWGDINHATHASRCPPPQPYFHLHGLPGEASSGRTFSYLYIMMPKATGSRRYHAPLCNPTSYLDRTVYIRAYCISFVVHPLLTIVSMWQCLPSSILLSIQPTDTNVISTSNQAAPRSLHCPL